ncbi:MAG: hypothetical protein QW112_00330, partial [Candidatus Micrarchaeia archaeon]
MLEILKFIKVHFSIFLGGIIVAHSASRSNRGDDSFFSLKYCMASRFLLISFLVFMALSVSQVYAASGDIKVTVTREAGGPTSGFVVEIKCTGGSYAQLAGNPTTDENGVVQGSPAIASDCDNNGEAVDIRVSKDGYVTKELPSGTSGYTYSTTADPNDYAVTGVQFTVKVTVQDEFGAPITGATAAVTGGLTAVDGGANDADSTSNGIIYIAQDPSGLGSGPHTMTVSKTGTINYLNWVDATKTISSAAQAVYISANQYNLAISLNTSTAQVGDTIKANASNYPAGQINISLTVDGVPVLLNGIEGTTNNSQGQVTANADGTWNATFVLLNRSKGTKNVFAKNVTTAQTGNTTVTVNPKVVSVSPSIGIVGSPITITITGFTDEGQQIWMGSTQCLNASDTTATNGYAQFAALIPAKPQGTYDIKVNSTNDPTGAILASSVTVTPKVVSIAPNEGNVNSTASNSTAIINVTGYAAGSSLTIKFNSTTATVLSGG